MIGSGGGGSVGLRTEREAGRRSDGDGRLIKVLWMQEVIPKIETNRQEQMMMLPGSLDAGPPGLRSETRVLLTTNIRLETEECIRKSPWSRKGPLWMADRFRNGVCLKAGGYKDGLVVGTVDV